MDFKSIIPFGREDNYLSDLKNEVDKINSLLKNFNRPLLGMNEGFLSPDVDIIETDKEIKLTAELPGVNEEDISVTFDGNVLTVKGEKKVKKEEKSETYHRVERSYGHFTRSFTLPYKIDPKKIDATFKNGVLNVVMAKPQGSEVKGISVKIRHKD